MPTLPALRKAQVAQVGRIEKGTVWLGQYSILEGETSNIIQQGY